MGGLLLAEGETLGECGEFVGVGAVGVALDFADAVFYLCGVDALKACQCAFFGAVFFF